MNSIEVLNSHNLKRTSCREGIIDVMLTAKEALSENEIRDKLLGNYDRTTFYRSFKTLEEHHILHRIVVDNLKVKYAVNPALTGAQAHAHFYCKECNTVLCLTHIPIQNPLLPQGYLQTETELLIKGYCSRCLKPNPHHE
jgi:Fur family ferric uptake transcriptional regulator